MKSYATLTDLQLTDLLKNDDEAAYKEIYARYAPLLADFTASRLFNLNDARDIIHDVFLLLWEKRQTLVINLSLKAYLFAVVRHRIIDRIRKNVTREEYAVMLQALASAYEPGIEQHLAAKELQQTINRALESLSPRIQEIYRLSREQNRSVSEIANLLGLSEQTVKNQLTAALKHLRKSLAVVSTPAFLFWLLS